MLLPKVTTLFFAPTGQYVEAKIVELTAEIADQRIHLDWWADANLSSKLDPLPIDRHWNWNEMGIEYEGSPLAIQKVAIVTGDQAAQGAMMISTDPVPSILAPGKHALFVELLFTAPRNRPALRRDAKPYFLGVGTELLTWGAWLSREKGCDGRLLLDGSPEYVACGLVRKRRFANARCKTYRK